MVDPHNVIGRQMGELTPPPTEFVPSPPAATLSSEARERAFEFVWETINERYYNAALNGVDWNVVGKRYRPLALGAKDDEAFWDMLDRMTGELKDAHTRVESPKRVELRRREQSITFGFAALPIDGRLAISSVNPDSDAWWAGVRPGMILAAIGGEPAMEVYERHKADTRFDSTERSRHVRAMRRILAGDAGTAMAFTFERGDATRFEATLARRRITTRPTESHRVLPSGFGYLRFGEWSLTLTRRAIEGLDELRNTPGLVIDLRGNPGGSLHAVNEFLTHFFPRRTEMGKIVTRTGQPVAMLFGTVEIIKLKRVIEGDKNAYTGPVVILVNAGSASGSELFAGTMQAARRAVVAGEPTCGCLLGFLGYARIPGGGELAYSEVGFILANNQRVEGEGVIPDHPVPRRLVDMQSNRDRALEEAQQLLATMKPWAH